MAKRQKEAPAQQPAAPASTSPTVDFDAWWALTEKKIPQHHRKEIIQADFRARGMSQRETLQSYNEALGKYGLKLN